MKLKRIIIALAPNSITLSNKILRYENKTPNKAINILT